MEQVNTRRIWEVKLADLDGRLEDGDWGVEGGKGVKMDS